MSEILMSYDLKGRRADYDEMYQDLEKANAYQINESCYVIHTNKTPKEWRNILKRHLKKGDKLFVVKFRDWSGWGTKAGSYLKREDETSRKLQD